MYLNEHPAVGVIRELLALRGISASFMFEKNGEPLDQVEFNKLTQLCSQHMDMEKEASKIETAILLDRNKGNEVTPMRKDLLLRRDRQEAMMVRKALEIAAQIKIMTRMQLAH